MTATYRVVVNYDPHSAILHYDARIYSILSIGEEYVTMVSANTEEEAVEKAQAYIRADQSRRPSRSYYIDELGERVRTV